MAINLENLGIFGRIAPAQGEDGTQVVNLTKNDRISSGGKYRVGNLFGRWFRSAESRADNNAARTKLLQALGATLGVVGMREEAGVVSFNDQFLTNLRDKLDGDPDNVLGFNDFKIKGGKVTSGRPLTERRVKQIVDRVRQLALNEMEENHQLYPIAEFKRDSIATLQSEQLAQLIAATKFAGRNRADLLAVAYQVTGRNENNLSVAEFSLFRETVRVLFDSCQGDGDATSFDRALQVLNKMRRNGKAEITVENLESAAVRHHADKCYQEFTALSPEKMVDFALKPENEETMKLMAEQRHSKTVKWMMDLVEHRNANDFKNDIMGTAVKPEHRKAFLAFCVRTFGPCTNKFYITLRMLAPKFEDFAKSIGNDAKSFKASDAWQAVFGEPAPEGINELAPDDRTDRFYEGFLDKVRAGLIRKEPGKYSTENLSGADKEEKEKALEHDATAGLMDTLSAMIFAKVEFNLALAMNMKDFDSIKLNDFGKLFIYDPNEAVSQHFAGLSRQLVRDFERDGARIQFADQKVDIEAEKFRNPNTKEAVSDEIWQKFMTFTEGMPDRQRLTVGFGLTQAGANIHGFVAGNGGVMKMINELRRHDDGSVTLKISFPEHNGAKPISYTYRVDQEGNSKIVEFTYGGKEIAS